MNVQRKSYRGQLNYRKKGRPVGTRFTVVSQIASVYAVLPSPAGCQPLRSITLHGSVGLGLEPPSIRAQSLS
jgi:hypothetical protein